MLWRRTTCLCLLFRNRHWFQCSHRPLYTRHKFVGGWFGLCLQRVSIHLSVTINNQTRKENKPQQLNLPFCAKAQLSSLLNKTTNTISCNEIAANDYITTDKDSLHMKIYTSRDRKKKTEHYSSEYLKRYKFYFWLQNSLSPISQLGIREHL